MLIYNQSIVTFLLIIVLGCTIGCGNTTTNHKALNGFESEVDSLMAAYHTVGASVGIIKDGKVIYARGFGYSDLAQKTPATEHTVYGIASCTKAFTAALFGILEKEGRLSLEDTPAQYIPELQFFSQKMDSTIQLKHILSHSTGLPNISTESSAVLFRSEDKNVIIPRLQYLAPQSKVGEEFIYNNYMYALAGRITERVTQQDWKENLSQYIFDPLQMNNSYGNIKPASRDKNFSWGYGVRQSDTIPVPVLQEDFPTRDAGGNIYSTIMDMTTWLNVWLNNGMHQGKPFLPKAYVQAATGNQQFMRTDPETNTTQHYGYGWMNSIQDGHRKLEHSGGISGYTSNVAYFPDDNLGIVVLSNQNTAGISFAITNSIIKRFLNIDTPTHANEPYFSTVASIEDPTTNTVIQTENPPSHALEDFTGTYVRPGFGTVTVSLEDRTLYATIPFTKLRLEHQEANVFIDHFTEPKSQVVGNFLEFNFKTSSAGIVDGLFLNIDVNPILFEKID